MINKIISILINNFEWINKEEIFLYSNFRTDLNMDSISLINLQILIEDEFSIRFDPIETDLSLVFETVDSLIKFIEANKNV